MTYELGSLVKADVNSQTKESLSTVKERYNIDASKTSATSRVSFVGGSSNVFNQEYEGEEVDWSFQAIDDTRTFDIDTDALETRLASLSFSPTTAEILSILDFLPAYDDIGDPTSILRLIDLQIQMGIIVRKQINEVFGTLAELDESFSDNLSALKARHAVNIHDAIERINLLTSLYVSLRAIKRALNIRASDESIVQAAISAGMGLTVGSDTSATFDSDFTEYVDIFTEGQTIRDFIRNDLYFGSTTFYAKASNTKVFGIILNELRHMIQRASPALLGQADEDAVSARQSALSNRYEIPNIWEVGDLYKINVRMDDRLGPTSVSHITSEDIYRIFSILPSDFARSISTLTWLFEKDIVMTSQLKNSSDEIDDILTSMGMSTTYHSSAILGGSTTLGGMLSKVLGSLAGKDLSSLTTVPNSGQAPKAVSSFLRPLPGRELPLDKTYLSSGNVLWPWETASLPGVSFSSSKIIDVAVDDIVSGGTLAPEKLLVFSQDFSEAAYQTANLVSVLTATHSNRQNISDTFVTNILRAIRSVLMSNFGAASDSFETYWSDGNQVSGDYQATQWAIGAGLNNTTNRGVSESTVEDQGLDLGDIMSSTNESARLAIMAAGSQDSAVMSCLVRYIIYRGEARRSASWTEDRGYTVEYEGFYVSTNANVDEEGRYTSYNEINYDNYGDRSSTSRLEAQGMEQAGDFVDFSSGTILMGDFIDAHASFFNSVYDVSAAIRSANESTLTHPREYEGYADSPSEMNLDDWISAYLMNSLQPSEQSWDNDVDIRFQGTVATEQNVNAVDGGGATYQTSLGMFGNLLTPLDADEYSIFDAVYDIVLQYYESLSLDTGEKTVLNGVTFYGAIMIAASVTSHILYRHCGFSLAYAQMGIGDMEEMAVKTRISRIERWSDAFNNLAAGNNYAGGSSTFSYSIEDELIRMLVSGANELENIKKCLAYILGIADNLKNTVSQVATTLSAITENPLQELYDSIDNTAKASLIIDALVKESLAQSIADASAVGQLTEGINEEITHLIPAGYVPNPDKLSRLSAMLRDPSFLSTSRGQHIVEPNKRIIAVGLPTGMLETLRTNAFSASANTGYLDTTIFKVSVFKRDLRVDNRFYYSQDFLFDSALFVSEGEFINMTIESEDESTITEDNLSTITQHESQHYETYEDAINATRVDKITLTDSRTIYSETMENTVASADANYANLSDESIQELRYNTVTSDLLKTYVELAFGLPFNEREYHFRDLMLGSGSSDSNDSLASVSDIFDSSVESIIDYFIGSDEELDFETSRLVHEMSKTVIFSSNSYKDIIQDAKVFEKILFIPIDPYSFMIKGTIDEVGDEWTYAESHSEYKRIPEESEANSFDFYVTVEVVPTS